LTIIVIVNLLPTKPVHLANAPAIFLLQVLFQYFHYLVVVLGFVWKSTIYAAFDGLSVLFDHLIISRTVFHMIKRAETEKAVYVAISLMTGIAFTLPVFEVPA